MDKEVLMWIEAVGGGIGSLALVGIIAKIAWNKLGRKQDAVMCDQRYGEVKEDLGKGDEEAGSKHT